MGLTSAEGREADNISLDNVSKDGSRTTLRTILKENK